VHSSYPPPHPLPFLFLYRLIGESTECGVTDGVKKVACLTLVDLAGSESYDESQSLEQKKEAERINLSLLALTKVFRQIDTNRRPAYVSYRDSKLTQLLKPDLSGNSKILFIACVNPSPM
jgi:hypothetical protein